MKKLMESWRGYEKEVINEYATATAPLFTLQALATEIGIPLSAIGTSLTAAGEAATATAGAAGAAIAGGAALGAAAALSAHAKVKGIPIYSETGRSAVSDLLVAGAAIADAVGGTSYVDQVGAKYYQSPQEVSAVASQAQIDIQNSSIPDEVVASTGTGEIPDGWVESPSGILVPAGEAPPLLDLTGREAIELAGGGGDPPEEPPEEPPERPEGPEAPKEPGKLKKAATAVADTTADAMDLTTAAVVGTSPVTVGALVGQSEDIYAQEVADYEEAKRLAQAAEDARVAGQSKKKILDKELNKTENIEKTKRIVKEEVIKFFKNREG
jgi:hypothetical protein